MKDDQGDILTITPFGPKERVIFWHSGSSSAMLKGKIDPSIQITESHQEVVNGETVTIIDKFKVVEVSIIP